MNSIRRIILAGIFLAGSAGSYSQNCFRIDPFAEFQLNLEKFSLSGKVKATEEVNYKQFVHDSLIPYGLRRLEKMYFDTAGRLMRRQRYTTKGVLIQDFHYAQYNKNGHFTEMVNYDSSGKAEWKIVYTISYQPARISTTTVYPSNKYTGINETEYDSLGNIISGKTLAPYTHTYLRKSYVYDSAGLLKRANTLDSNGRRILSYEEYTYDHENRGVIKTYFDTTGKKQGTELRQFDEHCRNTYLEMGEHVSIERRWYEFHGNLVQYEYLHYMRVQPESYRIEYDYDYPGNWIRKKIFSHDDLLLAIVERRIDYYE